MQTLGKALSVFGISPAVVEVFFIDHEEEVSKAKFADHLAKHGISYDTQDEYDFRLGVYMEKDKQINEINERGLTFTVSHNHMSTLTDDEYTKLQGRHYKPFNSTLNNETGEPSSSLEHGEPSSSLEPESPASVDWRTEDVVNTILDQGNCGSCWAFSATAALESAWAIKTEIYALNYAMVNKIMSDNDYPYINAENTSCNADEDKGLVNVADVQEVPRYKVAELKAAIAKGPTCVAVDANNVGFMHYSTGVFNDSECGTWLNHAITAVGYGSEDGQDYFLVRNSWGKSWGDDGYIKIAANGDGDGICGVLMDPVRPIV